VHGDVGQPNEHTLVWRYATKGRRDITGRLSGLLQCDSDLCGRRSRLQVPANSLLGLRRPEQAPLHLVAVQRHPVSRRHQAVPKCRLNYRSDLVVYTT